MSFYSLFGPPKIVKLFSNLAIWHFGCFLFIAYQVIYGGGDITAPLTDSGKEELDKLFDPRLMWSLLLGCAFMFFLIAFIGYRFGSEITSHRMREFLDQATTEAAAVFQNNGSLTIAVGVFTDNGSTILVGVAALAIWAVLDPTRRWFPL